MHTTATVEHQENPDDRILNTAQMRDAIYLQTFRIPSVPPNQEEVILGSVRRFIDKRKVEQATGGVRGKGKSRAQPRGRGRGRGQQVLNVV